MNFKLIYSILLTSTYSKNTIKKSNPFRILSIDGGGVNGQVPLCILRYIENKMNKPISSLFDLMAGTSAGSIITSILNIKENNQPKYSAQGFNYQNAFINIFNHTSNLVQITPEQSKKFSELKASYTENIFGSTSLTNTIVPQLITSFDLVNYTPYRFSSFNSRTKNLNYSLAEAVGASTNIPYIFLPLKINGKDSNPSTGYRLFTDGGAFAGDPEYLAYLEATDHYKIKPEDISMLSLGCGLTQTMNTQHEVDQWNMTTWSTNYSTILSRSLSEFYKQETQKNVKSDNYLRLNFEIKSEDPSSMDYSTSNFNRLNGICQTILKSNKIKIDSFIDKLI